MSVVFVTADKTCNGASHHTRLVWGLLGTCVVLFCLQQWLLTQVEITGNEARQPQNRAGMWIETISSSPKILHIHNLINKQAAEHLISLGVIKGMEDALITPYGEDKLVKSTTRTNTMAWLEAEKSAVVTDLERKIAKITNTQPEFGEALQILRYRKGQEFMVHRDSYDPREDPTDLTETGGNRAITAIIYLRAPKLGGETHFPYLHMSVRPNPGDAIVFWNLDDKGIPDKRVEHAGMPPIEGEKWVATKWIHEGVYKNTA